MTKHLLILISLLFATPAFSQEIGCGTKYSSLVVDESSGDILFEKRSDDTAYPASLVKMMTLYLTFEALDQHKLDFEKTLTVSARGEEIAKVNNGNTLRLKEGDKITVKEAVSAVIVKSFNEAAVTLAEGISGSEWEFVRKMNEKAAQLGMANSSFRNASGLHEEGQYTSGYDLARLAVALKKDFPQYYPLFAMKNFSFRKQKYGTHNHVLLEYKGAEGMKTGFTNASGFNLVSAASRNNSRIISIVLGCPTHQSRDKYTKQLLDVCFKKLRGEQVFAKLTKGFDYCVKDEDVVKQAVLEQAVAVAPQDEVEKVEVVQVIEQKIEVPEEMSLEASREASEEEVVKEAVQAVLQTAPQAVLPAKKILVAEISKKKIPEKKMILKKSAVTKKTVTKKTAVKKVFKLKKSH